MRRSNASFGLYTITHVNRAEPSMLLCASSNWTASFLQKYQTSKCYVNRLVCVCEPNCPTRPESNPKRIRSSAIWIKLFSLELPTLKHANSPVATASLQFGISLKHRLATLFSFLSGFLRRSTKGGKKDQNETDGKGTSPLLPPACLV